MRKHTPGPWKSTRKFEVGPVSAADDQTSGMVVPIADVFGENREADIDLIAAAPDLLAALKDAVTAWETFYPLFPVNRDIEDAEFNQLNKARAAICKALGLQPWEYHTHVAAAEGRS